jgi:UDP-N-acetylglucosamine--N-acetylmuramyl-(pentapeptide) pyrophosphoryl-undecaprenol N-acetylglucosamine transferase
VPALAVARALGSNRPAGAVELIGSRRGLDADLLAGVEIPVTLLGGRGLVRRRSWKAIVSNLVALFELATAFVASVELVVTRRPAVVVAVGGYASVAPSIAAAVLGVPVVVVNVDAVPGAANRFLALVARASAVAYPQTALRRSVVTGAPVRREVAAVARNRDDVNARKCARRRLGVPADGTVVAAFGGSLGARRLNEAVLGLAHRWSDRADVAVYHVVGTRNAEDMARAAADLAVPVRAGSDGMGEERPEGMAAEGMAAGGMAAEGMAAEGMAAGGSGAGESSEASRRLVYLQVPFCDHMELLYTAADVAVCRAGANTVAELTATGTPAVLVPLPGAPGDHQSANASVLVRNGGAVVIEDALLDEERLSRELDKLLDDPDTLERMGDGARSLGRTDAAAQIAALAVRHARRSRRSRRRRPTGRRSGG